MSLHNISNISYERSYAISAYFLCQQCLFCDNKLTFIICECDLNKKPTLKNTGKKKRTLYSRVYNPETRYTVYNTLQLEKLKEANKIYSYNITFSSKFKFSLCAICHNVMIKLKRSSSNSNPPKSTKTTLKSSKSASRKILLTTSKDKLKSLDRSEGSIKIYDISSDDNEGEEEILISDEEISKHELNKENNIGEQSENTDIDGEETAEIDDGWNAKESNEEILSEISFKLIIKQEKESSAAKWETINQTTFKDFRKELNFLIQNQLDKWVVYDDYIVSYKLGRETGLGTQLSDERDWERFLTEYQKSSIKKKEMMIFAAFKSRKNDSKIDKKRSVDYMIIIM